MPATKEKPDSAESGSGLSGKHGRVGTRHIAPGRLRSQYLSARDQLTASVLLLERCLDLKEQLEMRLDLELMQQTAAELVRDVDAYKRRRRRP